MKDKSSSRLFFFVCLIVFLATLVMCLRLPFVHRPVRVGGKLKASPLLSANDRSRWLTIRSLADTGSYAVENITRDPVERPVWDSIDKVVHHDRSGNLHEYSSKPPLLATMLAPIYIAVRSISGWDLRYQLFQSVWAVLIVGQILPYGLTVVFFCLTLLKVHQKQAKAEDGQGSEGEVSQADSPHTMTAWSVIFLTLAASFGTYLTTFSATLNNHSFAAIGCFWTLIAFLKIYYLDRKKHFWFVIGGASAAFTAANELPALSLLALSSLCFLVLNPKRFFLGTLPAVLIVAFAFFGTNLTAHNSLKPPYAHRSDGEIVKELGDDISETSLVDGWMTKELISKFNQKLSGTKIKLFPTSSLQLNKFPLKGDVVKRWVIRTYPIPGNYAEFHSVAICKTSKSEQLIVKRWDNWYDYPGSYWYDDVRKGVDKGEPSRLVYAMHCLVGHHGIFLLTPIWLLSLVGLFMGISGGRFRQLFSLSTLLISTVVIGFYFARPQLDRNYGGMCCGLRWTFWMIPLWLYGMVPVLRYVQRSYLLIGLCTVLLLFSIASACYGWTNPWTNPWAYRWLVSGIG